MSFTTASPLPSGTVGVGYSQTIAVTGDTAPYIWSITAGSLQWFGIEFNDWGHWWHSDQPRLFYLHCPGHGQCGGYSLSAVYTRC